jgi:hypothetical protein
MWRIHKPCFSLCQGILKQFYWYHMLSMAFARCCLGDSGWGACSVPTIQEIDICSHTRGCCECVVRHSGPSWEWRSVHTWVQCWAIWLQSTCLGVSSCRGSSTNQSLQTKNIERCLFNAKLSSNLPNQGPLYSQILRNFHFCAASAQNSILCTLITIFYKTRTDTN